MLCAILPFRRSALASRLSRPARSFFSTPSFLKSPLGESQYGGTATNALLGGLNGRAPKRRSFRWIYGRPHMLPAARHVAGRETTSEGPGSAHRPDYHTGGCTDLSAPRLPTSLRCSFKQVANRLDALKYREQGFGLRSLITCVKSHMQGDQMSPRLIHRNVKRLPFLMVGLGMLNQIGLVTHK